MARLRFPVHWFAPAGHDDAWPQARNIVGSRNCCNEVHKERNGAQHARGMMHQPDQFPQGSAPAQVDHIFQWRMVMASLTRLHELQTTVKLVHHLLPTAAMPPLDCVIVFTAGTNDPVRLIFPANLRDGQWSRALFIAQMDIPAERRRFDWNAKLGCQMFRVTMDEMIGKLVRTMHQGIMTFNMTRFRVVVAEARNMRVVPP